VEKLGVGKRDDAIVAAVVSALPVAVVLMIASIYSWIEAHRSPGDRSRPCTPWSSPGLDQGLLGRG
jgi:hypothetical protein